MGRLECTCGHVISDTVYPCPATGGIIGGVAEDAALRAWVDDISSFLSALRDGRRLDWIESHPRFAAYTDLPDDDIVYDLWADQYRVRLKYVWECESCGRLWIQKQPYADEWQSFRPEPEDGCRRVLTTGEGTDQCADKTRERRSPPHDGDAIGPLCAEGNDRPRPDTTMRRLLIIEGAFPIAGRGIVVSPALPWDCGTAARDIWAELRRPDGSVSRVELQIVIEHVHGRLDTPEDAGRLHRRVCLLRGVAINEVQPGCELWCPDELPSEDRAR